MQVLKNIWSQLHRFVFWALLSTILWAWIFTIITDTVPEKKVTLYVQTEDCRSVELSLKLEEDKPQGIRMIKVHPFSYAVFGDQELLEADLYAVKEAEAEAMLQGFAPLDGEGLDTGGRELYIRDGVCYGVKLSGPEEAGAAASYMGYEPGESYYLFFNANSLHLSGGDGAALRVAEALLKLD